ncbi:MAG TPA: choice-of-anchor tandem repeat GloVer-containing protein [Terriglobales bacterium]|nr:choice-of-anchor tandem repeat GloVer-containing protein [Terriglobales bacterium]
MSLTLTGAAYAQGNFKVIHSFGCDDGNYLDHGVTLDAAGNLYGVTHEYGCGMGLGAVFKLTPNADGSWAESVIHIFYGPPDAYPPTSGVIFDADGNLYGTGFDGGDYGWGAVYRLTLNSDGSWSETIIHSFDGGDDGRWPYGLVFDAAGNLYGTTSDQGLYGWGTVYKLTPESNGSWTETILYQFTSGSDGGAPNGPLVFDNAGNLYGTAGDYYLTPGCIFRLTPQPDGSWTERVLYTFTDGRDGRVPYGLMRDASGNFYGMTQGGTYGYGTIFQLKPNPGGGSRVQVLHQFTGGKDAASPSALMSDAAGYLYGLTSTGGTNRQGTAFQMRPSSGAGWTLRELHQFGPWKSGVEPTGLISDAAGNFYGTTWAGGADGLGTVFQFKPGK